MGIFRLKSAFRCAGWIPFSSAIPQRPSRATEQRALTTGRYGPTVFLHTLAMLCADKGSDVVCSLVSPCINWISCCGSDVQGCLPTPQVLDERLSLCTGHWHLNNSPYVGCALSYTVTRYDRHDRSLTCLYSSYERHSLHSTPSVTSLHRVYHGKEGTKQIQTCASTIEQKKGPWGFKRRGYRYRK